MNQIARQLNMHSAIDLTQLNSALLDLAQLRASIMKALGYSEKPSDLDPDNSGVRHDH